MIYAAGDLGVRIDLGDDEPGMVLQRREKDGWHDYQADGKPVTAPIDIESLPSGINFLGFSRCAGFSITNRDGAGSR